LLLPFVLLYPLHNKNPTAAKNAGNETGPHTRNGFVGNLSRKNPPINGPLELPMDAHNPSTPMFFPISSGLDIFPMAENIVGTNSISPVTRTMTAPNAGINDLTQLIDKNPRKYKILPITSALRAPSRAIRCEIGY